MAGLVMEVFHCRGWAHFIINDKGYRHVHIIPEQDILDHQLTNECWCLPIEDLKDADQWSHIAADGREAYEEGSRKPH